MEDTHHVPVLLHESVDGLRLKAGDVVVDATLGAGGHTSEIAKKFDVKVKIIGFDLDQNALDIAVATLKILARKLALRK
jgi:16S rRNA (cytosine1402-N4)-methyltransferase